MGELFTKDATNQKAVSVRRLLDSMNELAIYNNEYFHLIEQSRV